MKSPYNLLEEAAMYFNNHEISIAIAQKFGGLVRQHRQFAWAMIPDLTKEGRACFARTTHFPIGTHGGRVIWALPLSASFVLRHSTC
jgi:hypothetical protein